MAVVRLVEFEGVTHDRLEEMKREMEGTDPPEGLAPEELIALHDAEAETAVVLVFFANEDDYRRGDEVLNAMSAEDTPGRRTSVKKYDVIVRRSA
ncbi:MAG: hypothetical protein ACM3QU_03680 [Verrucomicrobiota bacterium]